MLSDVQARILSLVGIANESHDLGVAGLMLGLMCFPQPPPVMLGEATCSVLASLKPMLGAS